MYKFLSTLLIISFLSGCTGNPTAVRGEELANKNLYKDRSPVRVEVKVLEGGGAVISRVWAGTKGTSIINSADNILKNDVSKLFQEKCGLQESDLKEVRVVEHNHPFYYEVWIFNDAKAKRFDGETGISLVLNFPPTGGTDINWVGDCHA